MEYFAKEIYKKFVISSFRMIYYRPHQMLKQTARHAGQKYSRIGIHFDKLLFSTRQLVIVAY